MSWKSGYFKIGDLMLSQDTSIDIFENTSNYIISRGKNSCRVLSKSEVDFFDTPVIMKAIFLNGKLEYIYLIPILKIDAPNYPDSAYEKKKWEESKRILQTALGNPDVLSEINCEYKFTNGIICTKRIIEGKEKYTGGDICIIFER